MAERGFDGGDFRIHVHADLHGQEFIVNRKIEETFLLRIVHILDQDKVVTGLLRLRCTCGRPEPFPVLLYVEVVAPVGNRHCIYSIVCRAILGLYGNGGGIGPEHDREA